MGHGKNSTKQHKDLIVIGGGAAGLGAAFRAKFRKADVAVVQEGRIGGDCTFTGCVPSKALLAAAGRGLAFGDAMKSVEAAVEQVAAAEDAEVLRARGIGVIEGRGRLGSPRRGTPTVEVDGSVYSSDAVILALGSRAMVPPIPGLGEVSFITNEDLFSMPDRPDRMVIIGGGPIGCEMAQAFSQLGVAVTVVEGASRLLPRDEPEASPVVTESLRRGGVDLRIGQAVTSVKPGDRDEVLVHVGEQVVVCDRLLVAVGRAPVTGDSGLEDAGVTMSDRGWIDVDDHLRTSVDGVYAAGDAIGSVQLTHAAAMMAQIAVDNALGAGMSRFRKARWRPEAMPWVTFTSPEVAHVGMTEAEASSVRGAMVAEVDMSEVDRAVAVGKPEGFIKLIAAPRRGMGSVGGGRLIGATVVAERAGEMIGELALAQQTAMFTGRLAQVVHPYPSWSMAISQAASQFFTDAYGGVSARAVRRPAGQ
jgi:pyruvate/2-oxoglutarate dehydrogenase complex dihydrolipoamide dehydrogenase (E3) component